MISPRVTLAIIFCATNICLSDLRADTEDNDALSRSEALARYKDFLRYIREKVEAEKINKMAIEELKAKRITEEAEREVARKYWIQIRDEEKRKFNQTARDQALLAEEERVTREREAKVKAYVQKRDELRRNLKGAKQVDPHDEFQVGKNYEEFEYEIIEEPEKNE
ncbi:MAG: hypothetical protein A4S09_06925 [Proteobacteria bacterium SG_bin7]|nr:MAG: hypothetical protein A4S09_06925 [Proteobacteria bacterium SG_bin7]